MSLPSLRRFVDWLGETDDHAEHHIELIDQVERCLASPDSFRDESLRLSDKLERWRYQHLHQLGAQLSAQDERLAQTLNEVTNQLADRTDIPPRQTFRAIHHPANTSDSLLAAREMLDPRFPLERAIGLAGDVTQKQFGTAGLTNHTGSARRPMLLYAPLYVSSHCVNYCTYCGFRYPLEIKRRHLTMDEIDSQLQILQREGFQHLLIVGGDFPQLTTTQFYCDIARMLVRSGIAPAVEIAPQSTHSYQQLAEAGVCGLTLYQETYDLSLYDEYHPRGPKSNYHWRLESHDRAAEAGLRRLGLGVLLGLADVRNELSALMRHGEYLLDRFPALQLSFSLPRIHEAPDGFTIRHPVSDEDLLRCYCALRVAFPQSNLVLSTREPAELRNRLAQICITQMSAGSSTSPGGYGDEGEASGEQFPISDDRSAAEVSAWLTGHGFRVAWKLDDLPCTPFSAEHQVETASR